MQQDAAAKARSLDLLKYQISEIEAAGLKNGEEEELLAEKARMLNAEKIAQNLNEAKEAIGDGQGAVSLLYAAAHALSAIAPLDAGYERLAQTINDAYYAVEEASYDLSALADDVVFEEGRLEAVEDRLSAISSLKRKYGGSIEEILAFLEQAQGQYDTLLHSEQRLDALEKQLAVQKSELAVLCDKLSGERKDYGKKLTAQIVAELEDLGMSGAQMLCDFSCKRFFRKRKR